MGHSGTWSQALCLGVPRASRNVWFDSTGIFPDPVTKELFFVFNDNSCEAMLVLCLLGKSFREQRPWCCQHPLAQKGQRAKITEIRCRRPEVITERAHLSRNPKMAGLFDLNGGPRSRAPKTWPCSGRRESSLSPKTPLFVGPWGTYGTCPRYVPSRELSPMESISLGLDQVDQMNWDSSMHTCSIYRLSVGPPGCLTSMNFDR